MQSSQALATFASEGLRTDTGFPRNRSEVVEELGIEPQMAQLSINAELDQELHENARLGIFPMVGGG